MVNYFFLEYFRSLSGLTAAQLSATCGKADDRSYYPHHLKNRYDFPPEQIKAMAEVLDIVPEWITQAPVVLTKKDLDDYIEQHEKNEYVLVERSKKASNQYIIVSGKAAHLLYEYLDKRRSLSCTSSENGFATLLRQSFQPDPDYAQMPLRHMIEYADTHFKDHMSFVKAFASQYRKAIPESSETSLLRKLAIAKTIPSTTVSNKILRCFADFSNVPEDRAFCDFAVSSDESVFNLFLATEITLSGWILSEDEESGNTILTLTNPKFLPGAKSYISDQISDYMTEKISL
ncbi:MAG: hypothetical protein IKE09_02280 [Clostridiales bacterium]|nr:hypothetical protein [Clostridiales bacterium]